MKYFKTIVLLFVLCCLFMLMSCSGDEDATLSNTELLAGTTASGKTWRIKEIRTDLGTLSPFECVSDNNITYFPDGRYEVNEGATKCSPNDPVAYVGTWLFSNLENQLRVTINDSIRNWKIDEIKSSLHLITSEFMDGSRTYALKPI